MKPIAIVGPSGVGKGTLLKKLFDDFTKSFEFSVSHTTRFPREGEADGVDYHFISNEQFEAMRLNGDFIEHAGNYGNYQEEVTDSYLSALK